MLSGANGKSVFYLRDWTVDRTENPFRDQELRREILEHLLFDRPFLRRCGDRIRPEDFDAGDQAGDNFGMILATIALDYWRLHRAPVASSLGVELSRWAKRAGVGSAKRDEIARIIRRMRKEYRPDRSGAVQEEVRDFQGRVVRARALRELVMLDRSGELTADRWMEVSRQVVEEREEGTVRDWADGIDARYARRVESRVMRRMETLIEPLDQIMEPLGRGDLGLLVAGYKVGKSLFLLWLAMAYSWQGWNVLFITLEDSADVAEDRLDGCVSAVALSEFRSKSRRVRKRSRAWADMVQARIKIVDATDGGMSVHAIEAVRDRLRASGFDGDVIIVDYDDEIAPTRRSESRRFEFAEIYRDLRQLASRTETLVWTASQAVRAAEGREIITGEHIAEDVSKVRKATAAVGLGVYDAWNDKDERNARTLHVIAHKRGAGKRTCRVMCDLERGMFYDADRTSEMLTLDEQTRAAEEV